MPHERSQCRRRYRVPKAGALPQGMASPGVGPGNAAASAAGAALRAGGDTAAAAELGRLGGLAKAALERGLRVLDGLGLRGIPDATLAPYLPDAEAFALRKITDLARDVGGGHCGPGPSSIIQSAALQLAGSRAAFAAGETMLGSRLADASRSNLHSAHELCVLEAKAMREARARSGGNGISPPGPVPVYTDEQWAAMTDEEREHA